MLTAENQSTTDNEHVVQCCVWNAKSSVLHSRACVERQAPRPVTWDAERMTLFDRAHCRLGHVHAPRTWHNHRDLAMHCHHDLQHITAFTPQISYELVAVMQLLTFSRQLSIQTLSITTCTTLDFVQVTCHHLFLSQWPVFTIYTTLGSCPSGLFSELMLLQCRMATWYLECWSTQWQMTVGQWQVQVLQVQYYRKWTKWQRRKYILTI